MDYGNAEKNIEEIFLETEISQISGKVVDFLFETFDKYNWIGLYIVRGTDLVLGPWRGQQATEHTEIPVGKGVCGSAAKSGETEIVPNVNEDDRYLSCFVTTRSEIVVPIKKSGKVIGEIDIDSDVQNAFDEKDAKFLETLCANRTFVNSVANYRV